MNKEYSITIGKYTCEVSKEEYEIHHEERERSKYLRKVKKEYITLSFERMDDEGTHGDEIIADIHQDCAEDVAVGNVMLQKLREVLEYLPEEERKLVLSLFSSEDMTERKLSEITGIPRKTINDRKNRILRKLKKLLDK
jgi:DNA-directed RNA polymerase specialized sigma24 family protein